MQDTVSKRSRGHELAYVGGLLGVGVTGIIVVMYVASHCNP